MRNQVFVMKSIASENQYYQFHSSENANNYNYAQSYLDLNPLDKPFNETHSYFVNQIPQDSNSTDYVSNNFNDQFTNKMPGVNENLIKSYSKKSRRNKSNLIRSIFKVLLCIFKISFYK